MDRNSIIGLSLIFAIIIGFYFINQPTIEELERRKKQEQDSIVTMERLRTADSIAMATPVTTGDTTAGQTTVTDSVIRSNQFGAFAVFTGKEATYTVLENEVMKVVFSTQGGTPYSVELKKFKRALQEGDTAKQPLVLFSGDDHRLNYSFATNFGTTIRTDQLHFEPATGNGTLSMTVKISETQYIQHKYTLAENSYQLDYELVTAGFDKLLSRSNNYLEMNWQLDMPLQEKSVKAEREKSNLTYRSINGDVDDITVLKPEKEDLKSTAVNWIAFKQQFFNATLISLDKQGFEDVTVEVNGARNNHHVSNYAAQIYLPHAAGAIESHKMQFFFGPNHYQTLKKADVGLEKLVPLGWGIFGWVNRFLVIPVFNFLNQYFGSYGLIILCLTLIFKVLMFPLVYRSYISTAKMRVLKPEMDELKEKYSSDPQKMQVENMKLMRKAGVSPLGGCIPLLLQMPILIALFSFFPSSFELRQQPFLWADDLSTFDTIWTFGKLPIIDFIYGDHVSLFTLLMTISTIFYTRMNNELTGVTGQMKYLGYIMPIVFLGVFNNYAAGLSYYYFLANCITFIQQFAIRRFVDEDKLHAQIQENKKKPVKKSKFQERLEQMAKQKGMETKKLK